MPTIESQMKFFDVLLRMLEYAEFDFNGRLLAQTLDKILAGTAGYQAGDTLKLGGVAANNFWNDSNCTLINNGVNGIRLKNGLIIQWGITSAFSVAAGGTLDQTITLPVAYPTTFDRAFGFLANFSISPKIYAVYAQFVNLSTMNIRCVNAETSTQNITISYLTIGR